MKHEQIKEIIDCSRGGIDWTRFRKYCGLQPVRHDGLFTHQYSLERTIIEKLLTPGYHVFVRGEGNKPYLVVIQGATAKDAVIVKRKKDEAIEVVSADSIVIDESEFEEAKKVSENAILLNRSNVVFLEPETLRIYKPVWELPMTKLIRSGKYFEIQLATDPRVVNVAQVVRNRGGIVTYRLIDVGDNREYTIYIAHPRCHPIGWCTAANQEFVDYPTSYNDNRLEDYKLSAVPSVVFEHFPLVPHEMKENMLVLVLLVGSHPMLVPGHVSSIINDHYYRVTFCTKNGKMHGVMTANSHSSIYNCGYADEPANPNLAILRPTQVNGQPMKAEGFSWKAYAEAFGIEKTAILTTAEQIPRRAEPIPAGRKVLAMRYAEILHTNKAGLCRMLPVVTVRSNNQWVWFVRADLPDCREPFMLDLSDPSCELFRAGTSRAYGVPCVQPVIDERLFQEKDEVKLQRYSSVPRPCFARPSELGQTVPSLRFYPAVYTKNEQVCPTLYINWRCRISPWFDEVKFRALSTIYRGGSLFLLIKLIIEELISCTRAENLNIIRNSLDLAMELPQEVRRVDGVPNVQVKWKVKPRTQEFTMINVSTCESAAEFRGWLMFLLRSFCCCPNLISVDQRKEGDECPFHCEDYGGGEAPKPATAVSSSTTVNPLAPQIPSQAPLRTTPLEMPHRARNDSSPERKRAKVLSPPLPPPLLKPLFARGGGGGGLGSAGSSASEDGRSPSKASSSRLNQGAVRDNQGAGTSSAGPMATPVTRRRLSRNSSNSNDSTDVMTRGGRSQQQPSASPLSFSHHIPDLTSDMPSSSSTSTPTMVRESTPSNTSGIASKLVMQQNDEEPLPPIRTDPTGWSPQQIRSYIQKFRSSYIPLIEEIYNEFPGGNELMNFTIDKHSGRPLGPCMRVHSLVKEIIEATKQ